MVIERSIAREFVRLDIVALEELESFLVERVFLERTFESLLEEK